MCSSTSPPSTPGRDRGHQAGPDHRAVGLVEAAADRADARGRRGRPRRSATASPAPRITVARRRTVASCGDQSAASLTSPSSETHSASTPSGSSACGMPGATLTHRRPAQQRGHEVPRRRPAVHVEHPPPGGTTGGVGEDHAEAGDVDVLGGRDLHRAAEPERVEVGAGHLHPQLVAVDAGDGQPGPRQRHQVAADAAAEVEHRRGGGEARPGRRGARRPGPGWPARGRRA